MAISQIRKTCILWGVVAVIFYAMHAAYWLIKGVPDNLLWACHLGSLLVGLGLIFNLKLLNAVALLWLVMGNVMWMIGLIGGVGFEFTSLFTHLGGFIIASLGVFYWLKGIPRFTWIWAVTGIAILQLITHLVTTPLENVNLAFRVFDGWESIFPKYWIYEIFLLFESILFFSISEWALRILFRRYEKKSKV